MNREMKSPDTFEGLNEAFEYATRERFKPVSIYRAIKNATIPHCIHCYKRMELIDEKGYTKPGPDRDCEPDFIVTEKVFECDCGYKETIYL